MILNTWLSNDKKKEFYTVGEPVAEQGEYKVYKLFEKAYLYTFGDVAVMELAGLNTSLLTALANEEEPKESPEIFLYRRALRTKEKGLAL